MRVAAPYYDDPVYIEALAALDRRRSSPSSAFEPEIILASFHGMPEDYVRKGDPYRAALRRDDAAVARAARLRREQADADVPVALRPRQMARARHRPDRQGAGASAA